LFKKGIYLIKESLDDYQKALKWFADGRIKPLDDFSLFVNSILIYPPANYQSHHSIANEWALVRYFSMLESDDTNTLYLSLQNKIYDLDYLKTLHFKHIEAKANRQKFNPKRHTINAILKGIEGKKIGIIDDEINKGWLEFYGYILNKSKATAMPYTNFQKDEAKVELIKKIENWLREIFNLVDSIDIFIIDLRLHDDDFSEQDFQNLSGIQIIKFLKKYNPGIQVVVSTASNKVWNYQKCLDLGVKYFSVKESPETYNTRSETIASYNHFSNQLSNAVKDIFLAEIFRKIEDLKNNNIFSKITLEKDKKSANLIIEKNGLLDQIFNLLILDNSDEAIIHQCLLIAFQILENYCELGMVGNFGSDNSSGNRLSSGSIWAKDESGPKHIFINQPNQKISTWFELVNGRFPFQKQESNETPVSFNVYESMKLISSYKSGLDISSLVKMITILYFRDNTPKNDVDRIMALRYYRSNVAAHLTGKVKTDYRINANDISFFIDVFSRLFK
jgi:DNA-binding NarL/FixJ family response regulator